MAMGDTPTMLQAFAASSTYDTNNFQQAKFVGQAQTLVANQAEHAVRAVQPPKQGKPVMSIRRIVQVFIADPNENIPLEDCLLYKGEEKLTDATDQELFFELDIKAILEAHNKKRITFIDKKVKDRTEHLEPIKVRELKMVVVTVANL